MAQSPTESRSNSARSGTNMTSPPSEGSSNTALVLRAPANTIIETMGNSIPNPMAIAARLGGIHINGNSTNHAETQSAVSAPADIPSRDHSVSPHERYPEASTWKAIAEEDVENALKRLAMAAKDEHESDSSKTVQQHYSQTLAKLIKEGEIEFDASYLESS